MTTERRGFRQGRPMRPLRQLEEMSNWFNQEVGRPLVHAFWNSVPEEQRGWAPPLDFYEKGDSYIVKVELPGMKQEEIDLEVAEGVLNIKGLKKMDAGVLEEDYLRSEIDYGRFYRSLSLPADVDANGIRAVYQDGVLRITLKRAAGTKAQRVHIRTGEDA